jgi:hypothetical protein
MADTATDTLRYHRGRPIDPNKHTVHLTDAAGGGEYDAPYVSITEFGVRLYPNYPKLEAHIFFPHAAVAKVVTRADVVVTR